MRRRHIGVNTIQGSGYSSAVVGSILCSDLSVVAAANYRSSGKVAIGVVVSNKDGKLRIIALNSVSGKRWDGYGADITTLPNKSTTQEQLADMDGYNNSWTVWNFSHWNQNADNAIGWCLLYSTAGTQAGQWYLPAAGEFMQISNNELRAINQALALCGGETIEFYSYDQFLTSTEKTGSYCVTVYIYTTLVLSDSVKYDVWTRKTRAFLLINY